jgi:hypothetical protein
MYDMTLRPSSQGHRRQQWAEKENRKAPSVAGGAPEILCEKFSARETSLVHPPMAQPK